MNRSGAVGIGIMTSFADTTVLVIGNRDPLAATVDR